MNIKNRRIIRSILSLILVVVMIFASLTNVLVAFGIKKVISSRKISVALNVGQTGDSSTVSIKVYGLPANAVITK